MDDNAFNNINALIIAGESVLHFLNMLSFIYELYSISRSLTNKIYNKHICMCLKFLITLQWVQH